MSLILNINTSTETAAISLAANGKLVDVATNDNQRNHAGFLQPAIQTMLKRNALHIEQLDAVAVASGPGSYTGLRVGMASAKGLCYALGKPLIAISTLELMAASAISQLPGLSLSKQIEERMLPVLFCPMIDARRMEVFTALYDAAGGLVANPQALVLDPDSLNGELNHHSILFFGNGAPKWLRVCENVNAFFGDIEISHYIFSLLSHQLYQEKSYISLAYTEPFYLKAFQSTEKRPGA